MSPPFLSPHPGGSPTSEMGPWNEIICQGTRLDVTCPPGYALNVNGGFFGRLDGLDVCMAQGEYVDMGQDCTSEEAIQVWWHYFCDVINTATIATTNGTI